MTASSALHCQPHTYGIRTIHIQGLRCLRFFLPQGRRGSPDSHVVGDAAGPVKDRRETLVGRNELFALGDCGGVSVDSRAWGPLPVDRVAGRPLLRIWPPARAGLI